MMSFDACMNVGQPKNMFLEQKHFFPSISTGPDTYGIATVWHKFVLAKQHKSSNAETTSLWLVISFSFILCYSAVIIPQNPMFSKGK